MITEEITKFSVSLRVPSSPPIISFPEPALTRDNSHLDQINTIVGDVVRRLESIDNQLAMGYPVNAPLSRVGTTSNGDFERAIQLRLDQLEQKQRQLTEQLNRDGGNRRQIQLA